MVLNGIQHLLILRFMHKYSDRNYFCPTTYLFMRCSMFRMILYFGRPTQAASHVQAKSFLTNPGQVTS